MAKMTWRRFGVSPPVGCWRVAAPAPTARPLLQGQRHLESHALHASRGAVRGMESFATPYNVFFTPDEGGEPQALGQVGVHSVLTFSRFMALMAQKTNLPAAQLTAVFVCRRTVRR